ncbi:MAG: hypothetical protein QNJ14_15935 [Woeseiaceae bacterium]|nr:hypothetical protein [Woeseiaceae bacterium]
MEYIAKLLFATTLLSIFCYLLFFVSIGQAGNGGEYWGFNGAIEPWRAAAESFEQKDYRSLRIELRDELGGVVRETPGYQECDNHPFGSDNALRTSSNEPIHGVDSIRLARLFAHEYNESMRRHLAEMMNNRCELRVDEEP